MTNIKCLKKHFLHCEPLCQVGRNFKFFDYSITTFYCDFCNKVRTKRKLYFNTKTVFKKKDSEIPF